MELDKKEYEAYTKLLDEAYKNVRMASFAIDCIMDKVEETEMVDLLKKQNGYYLETTKSLESLAKEINHKPVDVNIFLKGSSFASIKMKTIMNDGTSHLAQMLVDGTTMGITQMIQCRNESNITNKELLGIVNKIIDFEEQFVDSLKEYL